MQGNRFFLGAKCAGTSSSLRFGRRRFFAYFAGIYLCSAESCFRKRYAPQDLPDARGKVRLFIISQTPCASNRLRVYNDSIDDELRPECAPNGHDRPCGSSNLRRVP